MLKRVMDFLVRPIASPGIAELYKTCVTQARLPFFYADLHAPDTVYGRFDMIILHVILVIDRIREHTDETQQLFDILFADTDKNLRELGISDISIAKKMKPMLSAFYGRAKAYEDALAAGEDALADTLQRNVFNNAPSSPDDVKRLAQYVLRAHASMAVQNTEDLLNGHLLFPKAI